MKYEGILKTDPKNIISLKLGHTSKNVRVTVTVLLKNQYKLSAEVARMFTNVKECFSAVVYSFCVNFSPVVEAD